VLAYPSRLSDSTEAAQKGKFKEHEVTRFARVRFVLACPVFARTGGSVLPFLFLKFPFSAAE
jgi:hypothetical protein